MVMPHHVPLPHAHEASKDAQLGPAGPALPLHPHDQASTLPGRLDAAETTTQAASMPPRFSRHEDIIFILALLDP